MLRAVENELLRWKNKKTRLPLLLIGAKRVGKTYLVEKFGRSHFENIITIDLAKNTQFAKYLKGKDLSNLLWQTERCCAKRIVFSKSLLFLDNIHACVNPHLILKDIQEKLPTLHVIAASSAFNSHHHLHKFEDNIDFLHLHPLSLDEFLHAFNPNFLQMIESNSLASSFSNKDHQELVELVRNFFYIGGMPEVVNKYLADKSLLNIKKAHKKVLCTYENFSQEYFSLGCQHIDVLFKKVPPLIGDIFKYSAIDKKVRARDLKPALQIFTKLGILKQVFASEVKDFHLHENLYENRFKLLFLDVGLLRSIYGNEEDFWQKDLLSLDESRLAKQFVGQELIAHSDPYQNKPLPFWENEKGPAKIDFVISLNGQVVPIEVKNQALGMLRSLHAFMKIKKSLIGVRISAKPLSFENRILSVPLYMIGKLSRLVKEALTAL
ncbi:MAG: ATP-binding protein [Chlamydiae bacterium]|nr:ATP-binding protein [Chlamydiota bacterium]